MNPTLRNRILMSSGLGAIVMASVMIRFFEGYSPVAYRDGGGVITVCYGHTGKDIILDKWYSKAECEALLEKDLEIIKKQVDRLIKIETPELTQAAIYSFVYNVGIGNFSHSTLLKKLNAGCLNGACQQMKRWVYADGKVWKGLMTRRDVESAICAGNI